MLLEKERSADFIILVVAPHPDDEVIAAGGLITRACKLGFDIRVVVITNGDAYLKAAKVLARGQVPNAKTYYQLGLTRQRESINALTYLGVRPQNIIFLGFADASLKFLLDKYWEQPCNIGGIGTTYCPYRSGVHNPGIAYTGENLYREMQTIIKSFKPTHIIYPHEKDTHDDHKATNRLINQIVTRSRIEAVLLNYLVHFPQWPVPRGLYQDLDMPLPPSEEAENWTKLKMTTDEIERKYQAILLYKSQLYTLKDFLLSFDRSSEIFAHSHIKFERMPSSVKKSNY